MRRREFLAGFFATTAAASLLLAPAMLAPMGRRASAQQSITKKRLAYVSASSKPEEMRNDPNVIIFFDELKRLEYAEGQNLIVNLYSAEGRLDRYEAIAREVVETQPDVIATVGTPLTRSFKAATSTIPIVSMTVDPIRFGIVSNLARPGGNITGVSVDAGIEIWGKRLALLSEAVPKLKSVAFVSTRGAWDAPGGRAVRDAAEKLGLSLISAPLMSPFNEAEYRRVFGSIQRDQFDGIVISDENENYPYRFLMVQLIQQLRLPAIFTFREQAEAGGLMSYSWDLKSALRRNAMQVAEILRGANPGEMPYFQESRFELVINMKTAKELGIEIPAEIVAGAAAVIE